MVRQCHHLLVPQQLEIDDGLGMRCWSVAVDLIEKLGQRFHNFISIVRHDNLLSLPCLFFTISPPPSYGGLLVVNAVENSSLFPALHANDLVVTVFRVNAAFFFEIMSIPSDLLGLVGVPNCGGCLASCWKRCTKLIRNRRGSWISWRYRGYMKEAWEINCENCCLVMELNHECADHIISTNNTVYYSYI